MTPTLRKAVLLVTLILAAAMRLHADDDKPRDPRDEGAIRVFPPLAVPGEALTHPDENFARLSRKIADGTANLIERREWYELRKLYAPFTADALPPADWRAKAMKQSVFLSQMWSPASLASRATASKLRIGTLAAGVAAGSYAWSHLGPTDYWVGDPPAATRDYGTGRGTAIWVNPGNKNHILLGTADGGVWKTTDQGVTWTQLFDFQPTLSIGSVTAVVGVSGNLDSTTTIYVATGEGNFGGDNVQGSGVFKSTDGGSSWTQQVIPWVVAADSTSQSPTATSIRRIVVDPNSTQKLWIAADSGIYRTINGGTAWTLVTALPYWKKYTGDCWFSYWSDIALDDSVSPSIVYAAGARPFDAGCSTLAREDNGIYRSTDDGATFTNITVPVANCATGRGYSCAGTGFATSGLSAGAVQGTVGRITLVRSAANKKKIVALVHDTSTDGNLGIWQTADATTATVTWTAGPGTATQWASQGWYALAGALDPTNATRAIVGGLDAYTWSTSTTTLNKTSSWTGWGTTTYAHADHHQMVWADASTIYLVCDGGFYVGTVGATYPNANSVTWVGRNRGGIDTVQLYGIGQHPTTPYQIHGGLQDNGEVQSSTSACGTAPSSWAQSAGGDGGYSATDQSNGANTYEEYVYAIMAKSTNSGVSYGTCFRSFGACTGTNAAVGTTYRCGGGCIPDNSTEFIAPMELDANTQTVLYTGSRRVYRNNPAGSTTWTAISADLTGTNNTNDITNIHSAKNNGTSGTIWAGTINGKVWVSTNATTATASPTWTDRSTSLPARAVAWIDTDPTNATHALVTFSGFNTGHVFRTSDGGATWTDISGALPNEPFDSVAVNPTNTAQAFAGSESGVYVNDDVWNSTTWTRINNGMLPNVRAAQLEFTNAMPGMLRVATHGRGFWETCTKAAPAALTSVTAVANADTRIDLSWTGNGSPLYRIYRGTTPGGPYTYVCVTASTTYSDTSVTRDQTYYYVVRAMNCQESANSPEAFATAACDVAPTALAAPTLAAPTGTCAITVTWTAATSACGGTITYNIYRAVGATVTPSAATLIASGVTGLTYSDTSSLAAGTTYAYLVRAYDSISRREGTNVTAASRAPATGCTTSIGDLLVISAKTSSGANKIEWIGPRAGTALQLRICYSTSAYPTVPGTCTTATAPFAITANTRGSFTHSGLTNGTTYYYTAFVQNAGATVFSKGRQLSVVPFDTTGNVKWAFTTTASVLTPPGIGSVFTSGNDRVMHSITPGTAGGDWPAAWTPFLLDAPSQSRPPVPSLPGLGSGKQVYFGTQDGNVYCVDGNNGSQLWKTATPIGTMVQGAANGIYTVYGGAYNLTLVGTRNSTADNVFFGLNALTGTTAWQFNNGGGANGIGIITSDASIDYATNRVYFTSRAKTGGSTSTAWCVSFTNSTATKVWSVPVGDVDGSPTLWNDRVYVGNNDGVVYALDAATGATLWSYNAGDGPVKGFINVDWNGSGTLFFTTTNKLWAIKDNGTSAAQLWSSTVSGASIPLFLGNYLLVGSGNGRIYQFSSVTTASPTSTSVVLGAGTAAVGSPSFDFNNSLAYVGTDAGAIYAVQIPLP
jgi:outer membrane protein assembly factor BamB